MVPFGHAIARRIGNLADDVEAHLLEKINESPWYEIQVDDSTDVDNKGTLLVFAQYIFQETVHKDLLHALFVPTNSTVAELSPWTITYQKDLICRFVSVYA